MTPPSGAFQFTLPRLGGGTIDLAAYAGQPLLIANTASRCGFTGQYAGLQRLWERYRERGLVVIGVPSNDFGRQEPGDAAEIGAFCQSNYGVSFPLAAKLPVSGPTAHPLFRYFAANGGFRAKPRWNFYKYVVSPTGSLVDWFSSLTQPDSTRVIRVVESTLSPSKHTVRNPNSPR